ncbi:MAG: sugar nucleotide-binding protein [Candidatus Omnitrophica bacterium]|nr:sugar nucleotide-binding protein [Candidatus Omnitrophota bacterium]
MRGSILVLGRGFIGKRISHGLGCAISERKIFTLKDAEDEIKKKKPKILINCAGHIGGNVDDCELDKDKTLFANAFLPLILAEAALRNKVKLIHVSTGCIYHFDYKKDKPINEAKVPDFLDLFYSRSKIYAERALEVLSKQFNILIARIRIPLDYIPHKRNILTKLLSYKQVNNLPNSVTYLPDFINALKHLIKIDARGIYNMVNKGALKYKDMLDIYIKYSPGFNYEIVDFKKLNMRRTNLILSTKKLEDAGFNVRDIHEVLKECVKKYIKY